MDATYKILLLDDDPDLLDMYREILSQLPSHPEVHTASSGARAMAMLEAEPFRLLISDLKMPKMDGLQVLSIVRRKYPQLRTVVLTSVMDEQFRSRVYALGVDLFWHKPGTDQEIKMFLECLESLLGRENESGFRGVQSKSLVDIIQLECISQSSSVLRITNGQLSGKIWIQDGEVIDADAGELRGEPAFQKILSWRTGNFETLSAEPNRPRTIFKSYNGLLLETAQALDESRHEPAADGASAAASPLAKLSQVEGVEFVLAMKPSDGTQQARGLENSERMASWARQNLDRFRAMGDRLQAGPLEQMYALGPQRHVALAQQGDTEFCVGWRNSMTVDEIREMMKKVLALWAS
ncbi:MAG TPA: response regulator [Methylomirabilota bacterium]|jgi:CheY-like chemotaxis protein|nr:response regulator [Methylomirabilota bacterium]